MTVWVVTSLQDVLLTLAAAAGADAVDDAGNAGRQRQQKVSRTPPGTAPDNATDRQQLAVYLQPSLYTQTYNCSYVLPVSTKPH